MWFHRYILRHNQRSVPLCDLDMTFCGGFLVRCGCGKYTFKHVQVRKFPKKS